MSFSFANFISSKIVNPEKIDDTILREEYSYDSFISWAARKVKGYSIKEIDHLAKMVRGISSHEEKVDVTNRIKDAIKESDEKMKANAEKLAKDKENEVLQNENEYLTEHKSILNVLLSKANQFDVTADMKDDVKPTQSNATKDPNDSIKLDDRT